MLKWAYNKTDHQAREDNRRITRRRLPHGEIVSVAVLDETKLCKQCSKPIDDQYFDVGDSFYHPGCFVCSICGDVIDGEFLEDEDGRAICTKDHSDDDQICNICKMSLSDETKTFSSHSLVTVGQMTLHSDCFKCHSCDSPILSAFFNDPFNKDHFYCQACYENEIAEKCFRCGQMITDDETIQVGHRIYHSFCFNCAVCHGGISRQLTFTNQDDDVICINCDLRSRR